MDPPAFALDIRIDPLARRFFGHKVTGGCKKTAGTEDGAKRPRRCGVGLHSVCAVPGPPNRQRSHRRGPTSQCSKPPKPPHRTCRVDDFGTRATPSSHPRSKCGCTRDAPDVVHPWRPVLPSPPRRCNSACMQHVVSRLCCYPATTYDALVQQSESQRRMVARSLPQSPARVVSGSEEVMPAPGWAVSPRRTGTRGWGPLPGSGRRWHSSPSPARPPRETRPPAFESEKHHGLSTRRPRLAVGRGSTPPVP